MLFDSILASVVSVSQGDIKRSGNDGIVDMSAHLEAPETKGSETPNIVLPSRDDGTAFSA